IIDRAKDDSKPTREEVLKNQLIGFPEDIKEKLKSYEALGINKMVIAIRKSETIEDPMKLFYDKVM
ncbi:MAG: hypothetical protein HeimAB125_21600, partial [Candidatus Heimdallarchaeota archaeon AB_125]